MLSAAKHLDVQRDRLFAAAQGDNRGSSRRDNTIMQRVHVAHSKEQVRAPIPGG